MKIIFRLVSVICFLLIIWVLIQNIDFMVDVNVFDQSYTDVKLPLVLLISFSVGLIVGSMLIALIALQYKAEYIKEKKKQKLLLKELDSLRNLSIDEIALDDLEDEEETAPNLPIIERDIKGSGASE